MTLSHTHATPETAKGPDLSVLPMTIPSLRAAYQEGVSPADVIDTVFHRIAEVDDARIFITLFDPESVKAEAAKLGAYDESRPLWGIPFVIKDNIDAAGYETTAACPSYAYKAEEDAFVVKALREAGAILIGKTNLDQFATGLVGVRSPYGFPKNALHPELPPGGSSSGSAVAVAHGIVPFALGTDTAGSGRIPAGLNNIVGLKPTVGTLSASGVVPACKSIETVSIFALTVDDAYLVYEQACKYDPADGFSRAIPSAPLRTHNAALKIGIPSTETVRFMGDAAQEVSYAETLDRLREAGFPLVELDFSVLFEIAYMLYTGPWLAERLSVIEDLLEKDPEAVFPVTRTIISKAKEKSAADIYREIYTFKQLQRKAEILLKDVDLLCVPTFPRFFTLKDLEEDPYTPNNHYGTYTNFVNLLDMCGIAVPTPPRSDGLPGGVTILARCGEDAKAAALGHWIDSQNQHSLGATDWNRESHILQDETGTRGGYMSLAVCGAHMSDLPLNKDLLALGANFRKATRSAPDYKFYALAGGPPYRPGMVKCAKGEGAAIELELWDMPVAAFGEFIATIPAPLGIGTITLADGSETKGFICEAAGTTGAKDITELANWRRYLETLP